MKNKMKKVVIGCLAVAMLIVCAGCSTKGVCDECGQEAELTKYVLQGGFGNSGDEGTVEYLCDDCLRIAKLFGY